MTGSTLEGAADDGLRNSLTVLIVNWNAREELRRCLRCLPAAVEGLPTEVVVVDNASRDGSAAMVREEYPSVEVLDSPENLGFASGIEAGLGRARGEFLAILNPDVYAEPGSLKVLVELLRAHPQGALAGPQVLDREGRPIVQDFSLPGVRSAFRRLPGIATIARVMRRSPPPGPRRVERVNGCCMVFRTRHLEAVGGMPRAAFLYGEEILLGGLLRQADLEVWHQPSARVVHWDGASVDQLWSAAEKLLVFKAARVLTSRRVMGRVRYVLWNGIFLLRELLYWLLRPVARLAGRSWPAVPVSELLSLHVLGAASAVSPAAVRRLQARYDRYAYREPRRDG